ncbi:hypothetical protein [Microvirga sp. VF16]|nr:hypothetical protein [Microvirga sp. VF16]
MRREFKRLTIYLGRVYHDLARKVVGDAMNAQLVTARHYLRLILT